MKDNSQQFIEILEEMKQEDYETYVRFYVSQLSENQWDYVISRFKEKLDKLKGKGTTKT